MTLRDDLFKRFRTLLDARMGGTIGTDDLAYAARIVRDAAHACAEMAAAVIKPYEQALADVANRYIPVDATIDIPALLNQAALVVAERDAALALLQKKYDALKEDADADANKLVKALHDAGDAIAERNQLRHLLRDLQGQVLICQGCGRARDLVNNPLCSACRPRPAAQ